jgi:hypothetical protein
MSTILRTVAVCAFSLAPLAALGGEPTCYDFEALDAPAPYGETSWWGINNRGELVANFRVDDSTDAPVWGGVYDMRDGSFEVFHVDGYDYRTVARMNDKGEVAGHGSTADGYVMSFFRSADGEMTLLDHLDGFVATDINNKGEISGYFATGPLSWYLYEGAVVSGKDFSDIEWYELDDPDWGGWSGLWANNDAGGLVVSWENTDSWPWFLYGVDYGRGFSATAWPDPWDELISWGVNNRGDVVGGLRDYDTDPPTHPGFVASKDGTFTEVWYGDPAEMRWTTILDINDHGVLAGTYDGYSRGFVGWPVDCD